MGWAVTVLSYMPALQLRIMFLWVLLLEHRVSGDEAITMYSNAGLAATDKQG